MKKLFASAAVAASATFFLAAAAQAQAPAAGATPASRYASGVALENRKDEKGAFLAYQESAEGGYAPAQRKLGEIYDSGNSAVKRDYEESIRWYQKARDGGEQIPAPKSPMPNLVSPGLSSQ